MEDIRDSFTFARVAGMPARNYVVRLYLRLVQYYEPQDDLPGCSAVRHAGVQSFHHMPQLLTSQTRVYRHKIVY